MANPALLNLLFLTPAGRRRTLAVVVMKVSSALLFSGSVWECVRFGLAALVLFGPGAPLPGGNTSIIWFASPQLVIAGMFLMLAVFPDRYLRMYGIVILAKLLAVSSGAAAIPAILTHGGTFDVTRNAIVVIAIVAGDLLLLAGLLVTRRDPPSENEPVREKGEGSHGTEHSSRGGKTGERDAAGSPSQSGVQ